MELSNIKVVVVLGHCIKGETKLILILSNDALRKLLRYALTGFESTKDWYYFIIYGDILSQGYNIEDYYIRYIERVC